MKTLLSSCIIKTTISNISKRVHQPELFKMGSGQCRTCAQRMSTSWTVGTGHSVSSSETTTIIVPLALVWTFLPERPRTAFWYLSLEGWTKNAFRFRNINSWQTQLSSFCYPTIQIQNTLDCKFIMDFSKVFGGALWWLQRIATARLARL